VIRDIEELGAKLQAPGFTERHLLGDRQIELGQVVRAQDIPAAGSKRVLGGDEEIVCRTWKERLAARIRRGVKPAVDGLWNKRGTDRVRALSAGAGIRPVGADGRGERQPGLERGHRR
jgi:hypothetical protein